MVKYVACKKKYKKSCNFKINIDIYAMRLEEYRKKNNYTFGKLAEVLGFSGHSNPSRLVQRWCQGLIPSSNNIKKIVSATGGKVRVNDFFQE